jgi:hypothetical protein
MVIGLWLGRPATSSEKIIAASEPRNMFSKCLKKLVELERPSIKIRLGSMLGLKCFQQASIDIAGIELPHRIRKCQFKLGKHFVEDKATPDIWNVILSL